MKILILCFLPILAFAQDKVMRVYKNDADSLILVKYPQSKTVKVSEGMTYKWRIPEQDTARFFESTTGEQLEATMTFKRLGTQPDPVLPTPFKPLSIPGTIQAEDYNPGGLNDVDKLNSGTNKTYRTDNVDLEGTTLINVGWNYTGDWFEYTVDVAQAKTYTFTFRVSAMDPGGALNLQVGGVTIGTVNVPDTNGWQTYQTVSFTAPLTAGKKLLRLNIVNGAFNLDWFSAQ